MGGFKTGSRATEVGSFKIADTFYQCCNCQLLLDRAFGSDKIVLGYLHFQDGLAIISNPSSDQINQCSHDAKSADAQQTLRHSADRAAVPSDRGEASPAINGDATQGSHANDARP